MPTERPQSAERMEPPGVATRVVLFSGIGLLLFLGMSLLVMHFYYRAAIDRAVFVPPKPFAKPRLQTSDTSELAALLARQRTALQSYAWIDRDKGIITIPIEEAMRRIADRADDQYAPIDGTPAGGAKSEEPKR